MHRVGVLDLRCPRNLDRSHADAMEASESVYSRLETTLDADLPLWVVDQQNARFAGVRTKAGQTDERSDA